MNKDISLTNEQILEESNFSKEQFEEMRKYFIQPVGTQVIDLQNYKKGVCLATVLNETSEMQEEAIYLLNFETNEVFIEKYTVIDMINNAVCQADYSFSELGCIKSKDGCGAVVKVNILFGFNDVVIKKKITDKTAAEVMSYVKEMYSNVSKYLGKLYVSNRIIDLASVSLVGDIEEFGYSDKNPIRITLRKFAPDSLKEKLQKKKIGKNWFKDDESKDENYVALKRANESFSCLEYIQYDVEAVDDSSADYNLHLDFYGLRHYILTQDYSEGFNDYGANLIWWPIEDCYFIELIFKYSNLRLYFPIREKKEENVLKIFYENYMMLISQAYNELESDLCILDNKISFEK